jgi:PAP2 superfamily
MEDAMTISTSGNSFSEGVPRSGNTRSAARTSKRTTFLSGLGCAVGLLLLAFGCGSEPDHAVNGAQQPLTGEPDEVLVWNQVALSVLQPAPSLGPAQNPLYQARDMAIIEASVFDAVNSLTGDYEPYAIHALAPEGSTANSAAAGAAYYALKHLHYNPPLTADVAAQIDAAYDTLPSSVSTNAGFAFGGQVAAQIIALRSTDGAPTAPFSPTYIAPNSGQPGVWVAQPGAGGLPAPALAPTWGSVTPFILNAADQFFPDAPPALDSTTFLNDLAEVESLGDKLSTTRTYYQTNVANFWIASAPVLWNPIGRKVSAARGLSVSENARLFALLNIAMADATIQCWKTKYTYNFWRPITAIQYKGNRSWVPFLATPPFPEYTSGHTTVSAAAASVLASTFGDDPQVPIEATSPTNPSFTHSWSTFSQGVDEVIDARVWSGIHYRHSDVVGAQLGQQVGQFDVHHGLRAVPGHTPGHGEHASAPAESLPDETSGHQTAD